LIAIVTLFVRIALTIAADFARLSERGARGALGERVTVVFATNVVTGGAFVAQFASLEDAIPAAFAQLPN
jgi:hypothetical protein